MEVERESARASGVRTAAARRLLLRWANAALARRGLELCEGVAQGPHASALLLHLLELADDRLPARLSGHCLRPSTSEEVALNDRLLRMLFPAMPEPFSWEDEEALFELLVAIAARCTKVNGFTCESEEELVSQVLFHVNETFLRAAFGGDEGEGERIRLERPEELAEVVSDADTFWRFVLLHCDDPLLAAEHPETAEDTVERAMQLAQTRLGVTPLLAGEELLEVAQECDPLLMAIFLAEFYKFNVLPCYDDSEKLSKEFTDCLDGIFRRLQRLHGLLGVMDDSASHDSGTLALLEVETLQDDLLLMGAAYEQILQHSERPFQEWNAMLAVVLRVITTPLPAEDVQHALAVLSRAVLIAAENVQRHALSLGLMPREEAETLLQACSVLDAVLGEETPLRRSTRGSWMPVQPPGLRAQREEQKKRIAELEKELQEAKKTIAQLQGAGVVLLEDIQGDDDEEEPREDARTLRLRNKALNKMNQQLKAQLKNYRSFQDGVVGLVEGLLMAKPASSAHTALQKENSRDWKDALAALHKRKANKRTSRLVLTSHTAVTATAPVAQRELCSSRPLSPSRQPLPEGGSGEAASASASEGSPAVPRMFRNEPAKEAREGKKEEPEPSPQLLGDSEGASALSSSKTSTLTDCNDEDDSSTTEEESAPPEVQWASRSPRRHMSDASGVPAASASVPSDGPRWEPSYPQRSG